MATEEKPRLKEHFSSLTDPRVVSKTRHKLIDIIVITFCAVLVGSYGKSCVRPIETRSRLSRFVERDGWTTR